LAFVSLAEIRSPELSVRGFGEDQRRFSDQIAITGIKALFRSCWQRPI
jgi:hypothetical protein